MAQERRSAGRGLVIAGAYEHLCEVELRFRAPDPRVYMSPRGEVSPVAAAIDAPVSPLGRALDAGEPVVVPAWKVRGRHLYRGDHPWLGAAGAAVIVYPDDRVEPTNLEPGPL